MPRVRSRGLNYSQQSQRPEHQRLHQLTRSRFLQGAAQASDWCKQGAAVQKGSLEPQECRPFILGSEPADLCPGGREAGGRYSL